MGFLNKKIISWDSPTFGLDLSDLSVKVVQIENDGNRKKLASFGSAPITIGSIADGEIIKKENVVLAIQKAIKSALPKKISTSRVVCSLPETKSFLRIINIPEMKEEEVGEAVKWEMEANIPLPLDQVYYDWQILPKGLARESGKMNVLVVAVSQKTVNQFVDVLESAGLEPISLEIESIAQARSLMPEKENNHTTVIIDLGDRRTSFLFLTGNFPCFTSSIPLSAQSMTDAISKALNLPFEQAEKIKFQYGIGSPTKRDPVFLAVEPILENFVSQIKQSIDFYLDGLRYSPSIDFVVMCGGGARTKGIMPYLSRKINKEIFLGNPWINFNQKDKIPIIKRDDSVQYSTAIGLALREI